MSLLQFLRRHWFNGLMLALALLAIGLAFYFQREGRVAREPIFVVDPARTEIIDSSELRDSSIYLARKSDGKRIEGDVTAVRFFFWNAGRLAVRASNVLAPIEVYLDEPEPSPQWGVIFHDSVELPPSVAELQAEMQSAFVETETEIIELRVLRCSRPEIVKPTYRVGERKSPAGVTVPSVRLGFSILDTGDGCAFQILFTGPPETPLGISGAIEGASIRTNEDVAEALIWTVLLPKFLPEIIAVAIILGGLALIIGVSESIQPRAKRILEKEEESPGTVSNPRLRAARIIVRIIAIAGFVLPVAVVSAGAVTIGFCVYSLPSRSMEAAEKVVVQEVPPSLRQ